MLKTSGGGDGGTVKHIYIWACDAQRTVVCEVSA